MIDITDIPSVYRNINARLLYWHLCCIAGYHDDDRDVISKSTRHIALDVGISYSAFQHAIKQLEHAGLVSRQNKKLMVRKWIAAEVPTPRRQAPKGVDMAAANKLNEQWEQQVKEYHQKLISAVRSSTKEELITWLEELKNGRERRHNGVSMRPNERNIQWLESVIKRL